MLKSELIGETVFEYYKGKGCSLRWFFDSLLQVNLTYYKNIDIQKEIYKEEYYHYIIDENGFRKLEQDLISENRKYPEASIKVLDSAELKKLSKNDLDIMRNEIFADHGYIFKSKKWKYYFEKQSWYIVPARKLSKRCQSVI